MNDVSSHSLLPTGYEVARRTVTVGSMAVEMFTVADPNGLAMQMAAEEFIDDERFPYWAELWPSSRALAAHVAAGRADLAGVEVVELGCGLGLAGVVAALLGAAVTYTDFEPDALAFAAANHHLNLGVSGTTKLVDWRYPPDDLRAPLVLGADVLYERRFLDHFFDTLAAVLAPGGRALIAEPDRAVAAGAIERLVADGFGHVLHLAEVEEATAAHPVWIHELTAPS